MLTLMYVDDYGFLYFEYTETSILGVLIMFLDDNFDPIQDVDTCAECGEFLEDDGSCLNGCDPGLVESDDELEDYDEFLDDNEMEDVLPGVDYFYEKDQYE